MSDPSPTRKYYIVPVRIDEVEGGRMPDIDLLAWTARYLSDGVVLVRDPSGLHSFPVLGVDVGVTDALDSLPIELPMTMTQADADAVCGALGLERVDLAALADDRAGGA